jgi:Gpi18-like mannosyltransferase
MSTLSGTKAVTAAESSATTPAAPSGWRTYWPLGLALLLLGVSIVVRMATRAVITTDLDFHILPWYAKLQKHGPLVGLGKDFYNYTPPYLYLLALATYTSEFLAPVTAVKLISTAFDIFAAYMIFKIVRLTYRQGYLPHLAAAAYFAAPTVIANTGVWGQADSTYAAFLLAFLYLVLIDRPLPAILFFGVALAFKPQAIFLAPFLLLLLLWRKVPWYQLLLVPVVYAALMLPAVAAGRTWMEVLTTYSGQAGSGKALTHNAATLYVFVPKSAFDQLIGPAVFVAIAAALVWVLTTWLKTRRLDRRALVLLALISSVIVPFFLPNMHDRYFYLADTISIALAFLVPTMWFVPLLLQLVSGLSYSIYLVSAPPRVLQAAAFINVLTLGFLLAKQLLLAEGSAAIPPSVSRAAAEGRHET